MDDVNCAGDEIFIQDCAYNPYDNCGSHEGAGVICWWWMNWEEEEEKLVEEEKVEEEEEEEEKEKVEEEEEERVFRLLQENFIIVFPN